MSKHGVLRELSGVFPVPAFVVLSGDVICSLTCNGDTVLSNVSAELKRIRDTSGAFLDAHLDRIDSLLASVKFRSTAAAWMVAELESNDLSLVSGLAARSSASFEDSVHSSFAGMLRSELNIRSLTNLLDAVHRVWKSGLSRSVIIERLRCGQLDGDEATKMAVVVQQMVHSTMSGVAFSHSPIDRSQVLVEAVHGLGERLVGGDGVDLVESFAKSKLRAQRPSDHPPENSEDILLSAGALALQVSEHRDMPIDIEWAFDGSKLWLLQARSDNSVRGGPMETTPVFSACDLYFADDAVLQGFRPIPEFANYFRTKRRPLMRCGAEVGASMGSAILVRANREGVRVVAGENRFWALRAPHVVLDLSASLRQLIIERERLTEFLIENLPLHPETFVIRDYFRGTAGMISYKESSTESTIVCETSSDGLLALNRGTARSTTTSLDSLHELIEPEQQERIRAVTLGATTAFGQVQIEWTIVEGAAILVDFSRLNAAPPILTSGARIVISQGAIVGKALLVEESQDIREMSIAAVVSLNSIPTPREMGRSVESLLEQILIQSEPVVLCTARPFAAFAPLVPHVAGFVFENASVLCHLAILLRERGVPAIADERLFNRLKSGDAIFVEN